MSILAIAETIPSIFSGFIPAVIELVPSIIIAVITSWLTVEFAFGRFKKASSWKSKRAVCKHIIDGLHMCLTRVDKLHHEALSETHISDEENKEFCDRYLTATAELRRMIDMGLLILPEEIRDDLVELRKIRLEWEEWPSDELWENEETLYKNILRDLSQVTKEDIKL